MMEPIRTWRIYRHRRQTHSPLTSLSLLYYSNEHKRLQILPFLWVHSNPCPNYSPSFWSKQSRIYLQWPCLSCNPCFLAFSSCGVFTCNILHEFNFPSKKISYLLQMDHTLPESDNSVLFHQHSRTTTLLHCVLHLPTQISNYRYIVLNIQYTNIYFGEHNVIQISFFDPSTIWRYCSICFWYLQCSPLTIGNISITQAHDRQRVGLDHT